MEETQVQTETDIARVKYINGLWDAWFKKFGPANKRTRNNWLLLVRIYGAELVLEVENMKAEQLSKKCGFESSFSKNLKEKFRQKNLQKA